MTATYLSAGVTCALAVTIACSLAGCANGGLGSSLRSSTAQTGFGGGGGAGGGGGFVIPRIITSGNVPNAQPDAKPSSALMIYVPNSDNPIEYPSSGGYQVALKEQTGTGKATLNMDATLPSGRNVYIQGVAAQDKSKGAPMPWSPYNSDAANGLYSFVVDDRTETGRLTDARYGTISAMDSLTAMNVARAGYHTGNATPLADMPIAATATYDGVFRGSMFTNDATKVSQSEVGLVGLTTITANFGAGTVTGTIKDGGSLATAGTQAMPFTIEVNANITDNAYRGAAQITGAGTTTGGGIVNGAFYGANAKETAGAVVVRGSAPTSLGQTQNLTVIGSYGAAKR